MAKSQVQFSKDNEYYTPKSFVLRFGKFDYDPATTKDKAEEFNIENYDTLKSNGLLKDWTQYKRIWIKPPFTIKHKFLKKAQQTYDNCRNEIFILFPIEFITTQRFHNIASGGKLFVPNGRINFESGLGKKGKSPAFGSVVMKLQDIWEVEMFDLKGECHVGF